MYVLKTLIKGIPYYLKIFNAEGTGKIQYVFEGLKNNATQRKEKKELVSLQIFLDIETDIIEV